MEEVKEPPRIDSKPNFWQHRLIMKTNNNTRVIRMPSQTNFFYRIFIQDFRNKSTGTEL